MDIPQIQVEVDLEKAQQYGLKPGDVRRAAAYFVAGEEAGDIHVANRTYDVNVWSVPEARANYTDILELPIDTPSGTKVQLKGVADIAIRPVPNAIRHEGTSRRIDVEAEVHGVDLGSAVTAVESTLAEIEFPLEYHAELLGEFAESQAASQRLMYAAIGAILVIFFLLVTLWESEEAIRRFAGDTPGRAVFYPEDDRFLVDRDEHVDHFEVVFDQR